MECSTFEHPTCYDSSIIWELTIHFLLALNAFSLAVPILAAPPFEGVAIQSCFKHCSAVFLSLFVEKV